MKIIKIITLASRPAHTVCTPPRLTQRRRSLDTQRRRLESPILAVDCSDRVNRHCRTPWHLGDRSTFHAHTARTLRSIRSRSPHSIVLKCSSLQCHYHYISEESSNYHVNKKLTSSAIRALLRSTESRRVTPHTGRTIPRAGLRIQRASIGTKPSSSTASLAHCHTSDRTVRPSFTLFAPLVLPFPHCAHV